MTYYYSASSSGFYASTLHHDIPSDAVEISATRYAELLDAQAQGKVITAGAGGTPVLIDPATLTTYAQRLTQWRSTAELTAVQLRLALRSRQDIAEMAPLAALFPAAGNLLDLVQRYVATLPDDDEARVIWEYATLFVRGDEGIATLFSATVGVDDAWIDDLYDQVLGTKPAT